MERVVSHTYIDRFGNPNQTTRTVWEDPHVDHYGPQFNDNLWWVVIPHIVIFGLIYWAWYKMSGTELLAGSRLGHDLEVVVKETKAAKRSRRRKS